MAVKTVSAKAPTGKRRKLSPEAMALLPYPDFPLSPHLPTRRWYKVMNRTRFYYGSLDADWREALATYEKYREDDRLGRKRRVSSDTYTMQDLVNEWLTAQKHKLNAGELRPRTFSEYHQTAARMVETFGLSRAVSDVGADDFQPLRAKLAAEHSPVRLGIVIQQVRQVFKWAWDQGKIAAPVRYGQAFDKPSRRVIRAERNTKPLKLFAAAEVRALVDQAGVPMKAMILLAINAGMGNTDVAELPLSAVDMAKLSIDFPRPKTGVQRRAVLWPETAKAIKAAIEKRADPRDVADAGKLFITKYRTAWMRFHHDADKPGDGCTIDNVGREFSKLKTKAGINGTGRGFYALRHTFETIAGETGDQKAVDFIMGHAPDAGDMSAVYREWAGDERERARLQRIADHVHTWLFGAPKRKRKR